MRLFNRSKASLKLVNETNDILTDKLLGKPGVISISTEHTSKGGAYLRVGIEDDSKLSKVSAFIRKFKEAGKIKPIPIEIKTVPKIVAC